MQESITDLEDLSDILNRKEGNVSDRWYQYLCRDCPLYKIYIINNTNKQYYLVCERLTLAISIFTSYFEIVCYLLV